VIPVRVRGYGVRVRHAVAACLAAAAAAVALAAWPGVHPAVPPQPDAASSAVFRAGDSPRVMLAAWHAAAVPQPSPSPSPAPPPTPAAPAASGGGCGLFDFACDASHAIDSWFAGLVTSAINPLFGLLGKTLLSTPQVDGFSTVRGLWTGSLVIADTCYVLLVVIGGIIVMGHQTLQSSYAAKDIAPRLVTGFIAANLSLLVAGKAIQFANGMSSSLAGQGLDPAASGAILRSLVERVLAEGGMFFILLALFAVALVLVLTVIFVARLMLTVVLIAMAPLALACHALPQTEGFARWWWRAFAGILAIQAAQALVLVAAARVFFSEQWASLIISGAAGSQAAVAFDAVQLLCLLYILVRIPFWIYRRVWSSGGRSPVRSAARFVFAAAVLRRISPVLSGRAARGGTGGRGPSGGGGPRGRGPGSGPRPGSGPGRGASSSSTAAGGRAASGGAAAGGSGTGPRQPGGGPRPGGGTPGGSARPQPRARPARHAAPPPLPGGGSSRPARHAAPPPLPADPPPPRPSPGSAQLPSAAVRPLGRHAAPPPLPARRPRHATPPPLPAAGTQRPAAQRGRRRPDGRRQ
jgi:hypothetical protein